MSDAYRTVTARIERITPKAMEVIVPNRKGTYWVARSLIHGGDELKVHPGLTGTDWTFRLMEWKADELGLA
ncbi:MAG: hypothetical protein E5V63_18420 [Mesorhizobium sp.]|nr:MAG: hypothetical protein E5V63_18420 [Mesorhizobium sp.]